MKKEKISISLDMKLFYIEQDILDIEEDVRFNKKDHKLADMLLKVADKIKKLQNG